MATPSSTLIIRAKWRRGWALMHAGKTTEGCDLLSAIKVGDLVWVDDPEHPERLLALVQSIVDRHPQPKMDEQSSLMEALIAASRGGDVEASDLLVFGDLGEL